MVTIVATKGCGNCKVAAARFNREGIDFKYQLINNLPSEKQNFLREKAKAEGQKSFPIILNSNEEVVSQEEILNK